MKKHLFLIAAFILFASFKASPQTKIGILISDSKEKTNPEIKAAFDLIQTSDQYVARFLALNEINRDSKKLNQFDIIWYHKPDTVPFSKTLNNPDFNLRLLDWISAGGQLFLSLDAFRLINILGIETVPPDIVFKESTDSGYGRMLGFHGFKSHPVFEGLNGGAYVLKSNKDIRVRNVGYYGEKIPAKGKVIAVDWDYIFLREKVKLGLEYQHGQGKIIAFGAYLLYQQPNVNRLHLEKFTFNVFDYLSGKTNEKEAHFWNFEPATVSETSGNTGLIVSPQKSQDWTTAYQMPTLHRNEVKNDFFDLAGERILVMGKENGGIDEIWAHPFMALRDYKVGIAFSDIPDSIFWLDQQKPIVESTPAGFTRLYRIGKTIIREILACSPADPQLAIHYEVNAVSPVQLLITFKSNLRIMWPYSEEVTGSINYFWDQSANCFLACDRTEELVSIIGSDKKMTERIAGHFDGFTINKTKLTGVTTNNIMVSGYFRFDLKKVDQCNIVISGSNLGKKDAIDHYAKAMNQPGQVYQQAQSYYEFLKSNSPEIITPDQAFNEGYQWALVGTDRFFVNTPGIGKSYVAGYSTTDYGWDGEHKVNGRPGYAWYFGRDAEWSGFAILHYGDFEKVRMMLETFQKYQDLNGKIYHELSTSGFAHYDASDATPLYLVLVGRYLKHSGDIPFIRNNWQSIKKAIDYCYSTDTDGDLLIENTNVGHGWEEGGGLFGCHTTLYLASCWAEALQMSAFMANSIGEPKEGEKFQSHADLITVKLNQQFWNENENYFYHGLMPDGSMKDEKSIMPAIPILFNQIEPAKSKSVAGLISGNGFTSDWGVRIVSEHSSMFRPQGYHTGSVWPLFTGWASLAGYQSGNHLQGHSHLMSNLLIYKPWAHGFVEEVLNGVEYKPSGVCHHQCWSETMVLQPIFEGMLGLCPDAINNKIRFSPRFPAHWDHVTVNNLRFGNHLFNFEMKSDKQTISYTLFNRGNSAFNIDFKPTIPLNSMVTSVKIDGKMIRLSPETDEQTLSLPIKLNLEKTTVIEVEMSGGISVLPLVPNPEPGDKSRGFRILSTTLENKVYEILFEGKSGESYDFELFTDGWKPEKFKNATFKTSSGQIHTFSVKFPEVDSKYAKLKVYVSVP